jgi:O-antigen ligase
MPQSAPVVPTEERNDPLYSTAQMFLYVGLFLSSLLTFRVGPLTLGDVAILTSLVLAAVPRMLTRTPWPKAPYPISGVLILLVLFALGTLPAITEANDVRESLLVVGRLALVIFLLPWLARNLLPSNRHLAVATGWLITGAAVAAAGTIIQYFLGPSAIPGAAVTIAGRFSGFTGHVSDMGAIASMGIAGGLGFLIGKRKVRHRLFALVGLGALTVGLVLSGSVSGMLAVIVALFVYMARRALRFIHAVLIVAVGAATLWVASAIQASVSALGPWERLLQTLGLSAGGRYSTSTIRMDTYEAAFRRIAELPFIGTGFDYQSSLADGSFPAHNLIVAAAFQGGVLLALVIAVMLTRPFRGGWLRADHSLVTTQLLAISVSVVVFAMTAPSLFNRYLWLPIALLGVAQVLAVVKNYPAEESELPAQAPQNYIPSRVVQNELS